MTKKLLPTSCSLLSKSNLQKSIFRTLLLIGTFLFGTFAYSQAVANDYAFTKSVSGINYTPITGGTVVPGLTVNGSSLPSATIGTAYPIGFNFVYNNTAYSDVYISDNGFVYFKPTVATTPTNTYAAPISTLPAAGTATGTISAFGTNLSWVATDSPEISYLTTGSAGSQVCTIQYKNMRRFGVASLPGLLNFQIRLYESNNHIEIEYQNFTGLDATQTTSQVGLRGVATTDFNNRLSSASPDFFSSINGTANNSTLITKLVGATYYGPTAGTLFVWTPCFNPTVLVAALQGDNSTVDISWTAPAYLSGSTYQWEVRTTGGAGTGATGLFASGTSATTAVTVTGLVIGQLYYFYVRSGCKTTSPWPSSSSAPFPSTPTVVSNDYITTSLTPSCASPLTVPYYQDFESSVGYAIPLCTTNTPSVGQALVARTTGTSLYGFTTKGLMTGGPTAYPSGSVAAANAWWFSHPITLAAGGQYKLTYTYGGTREQAFFVQKMKVGYGTSATAGAMTILADHPNIRTSPNTFTVNFTVASAGTYYLGFNGYAAANNGFLQIDNIALENTTCFPPTGLVANPISTNSASVNWTAPASGASGGYEYYLLTTNTPPIATSAPTGTVAAGNLLVNLSGLTPATTYYFWVRSSCGGSDRSQWTTAYSFTTTVNPCTPAPTSVDGTGITNVTFGSINNTTGDEPGHYGDYSAMSNYASQTTTASVAITFNTSVFDYNVQIWIDWNNDGDFLDAGENPYTGLSSSTSPNTLVATFTVPTSVAGVANTAGPHRMRIGGADIDTLTGTGAGQGACYNGAYGTFEDYTIYVVPAPPPLTISGSSVTYCSAGPGNASPTITVTSNPSNFDTYIWTPNTAVTGSLATGWVFNPIVTTVYTLTASKLVAGVLYINTATYTVNVNQSPTAITITPSPATYCQGDLPVKLTATGGILSGATVFNETFNGASTFTVVHGPGSNGGAHGVAFGYFTLVNSPFALSSTNNTDPGTGPLSSNDASQFYVSDSDAQGSGGTTDESLISPVFSLVGYTDANLSFYHFYKGWVNGSADVDVSTDGGTTWNTLPGATWNTTSQGTPTGFVNVVLSLAVYATPGNTNTNMRIRFHYNNPVWGYRWAIDNVKVTGSAVSNSIWSPNTNLFTNAAGTASYDGVTPIASVYANPSSTTVYTATVTSAQGCARTQTVTVNVTPLAGGTASGNQAITCGGLPTNLTLTGYLPASTTNITGWQQSSSSTFPVGPSTTMVPGSANQATLTGAMIGTLTATTYFRAVITGCNTAYSSYVTITVSTDVYNSGTWSLGSAPTASDAADINAGTLTISSNMSMCSLTIRAGANVIVNSGVTLFVANAVKVIGSGTLTINDSGSLVQGATTTTNSNTGNIVYKRNSQSVRKFDYTYWSSPVDLQVMANIFTVPQQPLSDKYFWLRTGASPLYGWVQVATPSSTPMNIGLGYIIRAPQSFDPVLTGIVNATFTGVPNNGSYNVNIVKTGANDKNCIGNPYPSAVSADLFVSENAATFTDISSIVGTTFYFWTHNTAITNNNYTSADYATYNLSGGTATAAPAPGANSTPPDGHIAAGQSFLVAGVQEGTFVAAFKNDMRLSSNNGNFYRLNGTSHTNSNTLERHRVWLDMTTTEGDFKQLLVGYIENATNGYEHAFDGDVVETGNPFGFYSIATDKKLAVQGRALPFDVNDQIPLGFKTSASGTLTVTLSSFDGLFEDGNTGIYLEDRLLNVMHDLRQSPYSFVSEAGTFDERFVLRYTNTALATNSVSLNTNAVIAYKKDNNIHVETSVISMKSIKIFDARGRIVLMQENVNGNAAVFVNPGIASQVLLIQVTSTDGTIANKKIIF